MKKGKLFFGGIIASFLILTAFGCSKTSEINESNIENKSLSEEQDTLEEQTTSKEQVTSEETQIDLSEKMNKEIGDLSNIPEEEVALSDKINSTLEVHFIDVEQSDATLIKCDGHYMLIDAGDNSKGTAIQLYLKKQGVDKLDFLILTHPDSDHIGGADVIVTKFDISNVFMSSFKKKNKTNKELQQALDYKSIKWITPEVGAKYALGSSEFTILAPNKTYSDSNNSSIALLLQNGDNKFLFTGDCETDAENDILNNGFPIDTDVYKAGHHGSSDASSIAFLSAISPKYAVISCGEKNEHGHPHAETMNKFRAMNVKVFRTDEQGSIVATSDGKNITWNCAPSETWQAGEPTGNSDTNEKDVTTSSDEQKQENTESVESESQVPAGTKYILNTNTKKFHYPTCSSVDQMKEKNKQESTASRDEIIAQGYVPCKRCNP